jgi:pyruvate/2-oxoglutarate/acetoin dehydrogenase E1 component
MNELYAKIADTQGAGAAIKATMSLLKEFGVARVTDIPTEKFGAFEAAAAKLVA